MYGVVPLGLSSTRVFAAMRNMFPSGAGGTWDQQKGDAEEYRFISHFNDIADATQKEFWGRLFSPSTSDALARALTQKFLSYIPRYRRLDLLGMGRSLLGAGLQSRFSCLSPAQKDDLLSRPPDFDWMLTCDHPGYALRPHTDHPRKMITFLLYLSEKVEGGTAPGTSVYSPCSNRVRAWDSVRAKKGKFAEVFRASHVEGHFLAFVKSDISWHGVEPCVDTDRPRMTVNMTVKRPESLGG